MLSPPNEASFAPLSLIAETASPPLSAAAAVTAAPATLRDTSSLRQWLADLAYLTLVTTGWMVGNFLGVLGCVIVFFIVLSAGQWDAFFFQVDNLTSRYLDADVARRAAFAHTLAQAFILLFTTVILLRAPYFVQRLRAELARGRVA